MILCVFRGFAAQSATKHVFQKLAKSRVILCRHTTVVLLTLERTMTIDLIDKIMTFCNNVNKTSTSVELLAINILRYML